MFACWLGALASPLSSWQPGASSYFSLQLPASCCPPSWESGLPPQTRKIEAGIQTHNLFKCGQNRFLMFSRHEGISLMFVLINLAFFSFVQSICLHISLGVEVEQKTHTPDAHTYLCMCTWKETLSKEAVTRRPSFGRRKGGLKWRTKVQTETRRKSWDARMSVRHKSKRSCPNGLENSIYRVLELQRKQNPGCRKVSGNQISRPSVETEVEIVLHSQDILLSELQTTWYISPQCKCTQLLYVHIGVNQRKVNEVELD